MSRLNWKTNHETIQLLWTSQCRLPHLIADEVRDLYEQYQTESGQPIEPSVVEKVYEVTRGQPGLVSWFGMLLTETYNPGPPQPIGMET